MTITINFSTRFLTTKKWVTDKRDESKLCTKVLTLSRYVRINEAIQEQLKKKKNSCISSFYQDSLLQSRKKVSGELSKEAFLDILLTDLEQSSFSLIFENLFLFKKGLYKKDTQLTTFKTSSYLFKETESSLIKKNFVLQEQRLYQYKKQSLYVQKRSFCRSCTYNKGIQRFVWVTACKGIQIPTGLKTASLLNSNSKICFVKPFFVGLVSNLTMTLNRKGVHSPTILFVSNSIPRQSSYLYSVKVSPPSQSRNMSFQQSYQQENKRISCFRKIGDYVYCGDKIGYLSKTPVVIGESGKILKISQTQVTIQKIQPVLFYSQAEIHVQSNEWVRRGTPILTLTHQTLVTGDIVQGIPRIEQLFEASSSPPPGAALQDFGSPSDDDSSKKLKIDNYLRLNNSSNLLPSTSSFIGTRSQSISEQDSKGIPTKEQNNDQTVHNIETNNSLSKVQITEERPMFLYNTLQSQVREIFRKKWDQHPLPVAVRQSLEDIQQVIVESIQKVYISQGVLIADKHIEIIVRQMSSKAQVFDGGSTGLLIDEILSLQQIENANVSTPGRKALYLPVVMGLTRSALSSDSFVSAASFQETTRVLSRDAVAGKTDFLRGLKEKVIIGDLIDAGTGLDVFYMYSLFSKNIFESKFRNILNRKVTHKTLKKLVLTVAKPYKSL